MVTPYNEFLQRFFYKPSFNHEKNRVHWLNRLIYENRLDDVTIHLQKKWKHYRGDGYGLTPWHIAAMTNNQRAALLLFQAKIWDINAQDAHGCTAMHHAAVAGHLTFIHFLKSHGASEKICNFYRGTPHDLLQQCYRTVDPRVQTFWIKQGDQIVEKTGEEFAQLLHATLVEEEIVYTPVQWIKRWRHEIKNSFFRDKYVGKTLQCYAAYHQKPPPKVYLDHDPQVGYFLRAGEKIPPFTMIGEYLGEVLDKTESKHRWAPRDKELKRLSKKSEDPDEVVFNFSSDPRYQYTASTDYWGGESGVIDAFAQRGLMAMMACSFPNVFEDHIRFQKGQRQRVILFSCEEIEKDAPLVTDYGAGHMVKKMIYAELREKEMIEFFKDKDNQQFNEMLKKPEPRQFTTENAYLTALANHQRTAYLLGTPQAMLTLELKDGLKASLVHLQIEHRQPLFIDDFLHRLSGLIWDVSAEVKEQIKSELLAAVKTHTLLNLYKLMEEKRQVLMREYWKNKPNPFGWTNPLVRRGPVTD